MNQAKKAQDYFVGLDAGTDSLGWAVTDTQYNLLKCNSKAMWGVHLFESGDPAEKRRLFRTARRRTERNRQRIELLREMFSEEICKVDENFFARLDESKFYADDKRVAGKFCLFNDNGYTDKEYHDAFPTVYHLRSALIHSTEKPDIRLLYLAVAHIVKHRGHFLFEGQSLESATDFAPIFSDLLLTLEEAGISLTCSDSTAVETLLKDKSVTITDKKRALYGLLGAHEKQEKAVCDALAGGSVKLSVLFADDALEDCEVPKFDFKSGIEEKEAQLEEILQEKMFLFLKLKAVYDWSVLADVLKGEAYLSDAKIKNYEKHKSDLRVLRAAFRKFAPKEYTRMFRSDTEPYNYCAYTKHPSKKGGVLKKGVCLQEDFCKFALKLLGDFPAETPEELQLKADLQAGTALPKQVTKDNSVVPYQLHLRELKAILENAKQHYAFLNAVEDGVSVSEKIIKLMTFRIPYYVGPLNAHSSHGWLVRKEAGKIYPWNFDEKVDKIKSAEGFIKRMTNYCTYLVGEKVLPKESVLYSKFVIYNQLNTICVDGQKLPVDLKNELFADLFLHTDRPMTVKSARIRKYLVAKGYCDKTAELTGLDGEVRGTMKSYIELHRILGEKANDSEMAEALIYQITVLGESKSLLRTFIERTFGDRLTQAEIQKLLKLKYSGWARLSETFLTGIYHTDKATGEAMSIMTALENTDENLMQLLSGKYGFTDAVNAFNADKNGECTAENIGKAVDELAVSPAVKRGVRRTLSVMKEITKIMGHAPKRIFIEMARGATEEQKNKRTVSRKQQLLECYAACKKEEPQLYAMLADAKEDKLRGDKLYLYYTQLGRCMYSGEPIDLTDLFDKTKYDIDHIYPQSKTKDDSLKNRVLVKRELNEKKGNTYPLPPYLRTAKTVALWKRLFDLGLIPEEKYHRLMRTLPLSPEELSGFIARQIVETQQATKATAHLLSEFYPDTEIVYSKAKNVSEFRREFQFPKCRCVNDYHHAKDAYLNIVVGNVYRLKFTRNPMDFIESGEEYSLNQVFHYPVQRGKEIAWVPDGSYIATVRKTMGKNNILFTRYATEQKGAFFDQQPVKKGGGQMPLKTSDARLADFQKYGGYNKIAGAYFALVRHTEKGKRVKSFEPVPVYLAKEFEAHPEKLLSYFTSQLQDPEILLPKVKINTLFSVDGFKMHLSGRTGKQLLFKNANQLVLPEEQYAYFHKIEKWIEKNKKYKSVQPLPVAINEQTNLEIYDALYLKLRDTVYNRRLSAQVATFENCREEFRLLSLADQCVFLSNALKMFQCNPSPADLSLVGGVKSGGILVLSNNISKLSDIKLIFQSVTGIFENELDLEQL